MNASLDRRSFLELAGTTTAAAVGATVASAAPAARAADAPPADRPILLLGVACSPRAGKTTAVAVRTALESAAAVSPRIRTELLDLGGLRIAGWSPVIVPDDFDALLPKFRSPDFGGLIVGSPSFFRSLSSLCKAFIERCMPLRDAPSPLADKPVGALAIAGNRHGGQELVVQQILTAMLSYSMIPVGGSAPALLGGTLWNRAGDDLSQDEDGLKTARLLGTHVAQVALKLRA